jgi:hypothetical protein
MRREDMSPVVSHDVLTQNMAWNKNGKACWTVKRHWCVFDPLSLSIKHTNTTFQKQTAFVFRWTKAVWFWNIVFVCFVLSDEGKVQIHISDVLHVTSLSKNYVVHAELSFVTEPIELMRHLLPGLIWPVLTGLYIMYIILLFPMHS